MSEDMRVLLFLRPAYKEAGEYENALESLKRAVDAGDFDELDEARAELIDLEQG